MKISKVTTYILRVPLGKEKFCSSQCFFPERNSMLVRIETDDGLVGWGEGGQYGPPEPVCSCIESVIADKLMNQNPLDKGRIWDSLYSFFRDFGQKGPYIEALSAIDIALWDLSGKYLGQPIKKLIGGDFWEKIPAYATGCYYTEDDLQDFDNSLRRLALEAESYVKTGFKIMKMKIGLLSIEEDIKRVKAVRNAVGSDMVMLVDCNHSYNTYSALRMGKLLEEYDIRWYEEPVLPENKEGYRNLRKALNIAIAGGECEYTKYGFKDLITNECLDIVQPDICVCGGITETLKILALAQAYNTIIIPHVWGSGIALAAALQFLSIIPPCPHTYKPIPMQNMPVVEFDRNLNPLRDNLLTTPIINEDNCVKVPNGPGLGVEVDSEVLDKYCTYKKEIKKV